MVLFHWIYHSRRDHGGGCGFESQRRIFLLFYWKGKGRYRLHLPLSTEDKLNCQFIPNKKILFSVCTGSPLRSKVQCQTNQFCFNVAKKSTRKFTQQSDHVLEWHYISSTECSTTTSQSHLDEGRSLPSKIDHVWRWYYISSTECRTTTRQSRIASVPKLVFTVPVTVILRLISRATRYTGPWGGRVRFLRNRNIGSDPC